jgi:hypothetical protein
MSLIQLFHEIRNNNLENLKKIVASYPDLLNKYLYGVTPFHYSIECENQNIAVEIALNPNIDLELKDNLSISCLEKAIQNKMYKIVEIICKNHKNLDRLNNQIINNETLLTNSLKMDEALVTIALIKGILNIKKKN